MNNYNIVVEQNMYTIYRVNISYIQCNVNVNVNVNLDCY